jgi:hypothetical protein
VPVNFLRRRRARLLIARTQPFADEPLVAAANFTWLGNSMGAQSGVRGRDDLAAGIPNWTLIGAGATRLFVAEATHANPDRGAALFGSWPLNQVRLTEQSYDRKAGPVRLGAYRTSPFCVRIPVPETDWCGRRKEVSDMAELAEVELDEHSLPYFFVLERRDGANSR